MHKAGEIFLNCLAQGVGIKGLLKSAFELLQMPMHILDPSFLELERIGGEDLQDLRWLEYRDTGYISEVQLRRLRTSGFLEKVQTAGEPVVDKSIPGMDVIGCDVYARGKLLARLGIWCIRPYTQDDLAIVKVFGKALSAELQKSHPSYLDLNRQSEYFLNKIISNQIETDDMVNALAERYNVKKTPQMRLFLVRQETGGDGVSTPEYQKNRLGRQRFALMASSLRGLVAVVIDNKGFSTWMESFPFSPHFGELLCGISREFHSLESLFEAYREAEAALRFGEGKQVCTLYDEVFFFDLLSLSGNTRGDIQKLCSPSILKLKERDDSTGSSLMETLEVYILNSGNMKKTAESLNIHYNTMKYRMETIKQTPGLESLSYLELFKAYLSILMLKKNSG